MRAHRPFFVIRNSVTGQVKRVGFASGEDSSVWQVLLTDGSQQSAMNHPEAAGMRPAASKRRRKEGKPKASRRSVQR